MQKAAQPSTENYKNRVLVLSLLWSTQMELLSFTLVGPEG